MICESCLEAGAAIQASRTVTPSLVSTMEQLAMSLHQECKGGTWCDCQHRLSGVNWLAVNGH